MRLACFASRAFLEPAGLRALHTGLSLKLRMSQIYMGESAGLDQRGYHSSQHLVTERSIVKENSLLVAP